MTRDLFQPGDRLGDYEIRSRLCAGGMATLFLAQRHGAAGVSRAVVIKAIHPHLAHNELIVRMFIDEARISSHIRHSNVVYVEEFGEQDGVYYIAMEYVDGCSLYQVLHACKVDAQKLSAALAVHIAIEVAAGLHAAHETTGEDGAPLGIVHRDVSPSNVLLTRDGRVKVIDFGIAKARGRLGVTRSGSGLKGKLCYMAPEQAWAQPVDRRTDVYALGVCLWELLTGRQLFRATSDFAVLELVRDPSVPPPSKLNPEVRPVLDAIVLRATARRPEDRYPTALELRRDLMAAVPGAVAVPPEVVAELVHHVCRSDRAAIGNDESTDDMTEPSSVAPAPSSGAAVDEARPRAWRTRGVVFAAIAGACAIGIAIAVAGGSGEGASAIQTPTVPAAAIDAGASRIAEPAPVAPVPETTPDPAPAAEVADPVVVEAPVVRSPPAVRGPGRVARQTDEPRIQTIEADGALLADEPTPRSPSGPSAKTTATNRATHDAKNEPRPDNAIRADDAVLAK